MQEVLELGKPVKTLTRIFPGEQIEFGLDNQGKLQEIRYPINNLKTLRVQRTANGKFAAEELLKEVETRTEVVSGVVNGSFWNAGLEAGLTEAQMLTLANNIFSYDIDFGLDIKAGDSFSVILRPVMPTVNLLVTGIFSPHSLKTKARCIRQFVTRTALLQAGR